ncbi:endolytic transglycosylase MltG [Glaciihabitans tibetensis]|nr:endolytic transglycosylase MltG [Glaciihabitans tibetensis]
MPATERPTSADDEPLTVDQLFGPSSADGKRGTDPDSGASWPPPPHPSGRPPRRRRLWLIWLWVLVVLLALVGGAAAAVWVMFEDQVRQVLGIELPNDYEGTGNGEAVTVTIVSGDVGGDIATKLEEAGVTMTYDAFYDLLVAQEVQPTFMPGSYPLQKEMSAQSALDVLANPANVATSRVLITEGSTLPQTLASLSEGTGLPLSDFEAVAANYTAFGVPATAPSLEGWLFPATYEFEPGVTAQQILQTMADRMLQSLDAAGVAVADRQRVLTLASIVQKEGGSIEDFPIVARLFLNRLAMTPPMNLESDATVSYGTGGTSIFTTDEERGDASNLYNTYANPGLPVGPISAPGDDAINAVLNPAVGDWVYMVLVNGDTGETKFSVTFAEHEAAVLEWQDWIRANPDWDN